MMLRHLLVLATATLCVAAAAAAACDKSPDAVTHLPGWTGGAMECNYANMVRFLHGPRSALATAYADHASVFAGYG